MEGQLKETLELLAGRLALPMPEAASPPWLPPRHPLSRVEVTFCIDWYMPGYMPGMAAGRQSAWSSPQVSLECHRESAWYSSNMLRGRRCGMATQMPGAWLLKCNLQDWSTHCRQYAS